ncbi:SDR family NAD(P)-dependent oxidoreductase [Nibricoccus sp. IMCC34717]|uniref:SDR family NAD(P)-dependent oxidoreductase n=1 Tax=Nibricoccus sp. IMCC34717 TaxID=3034021 RepID=UPI003850448D
MPPSPVVLLTGASSGIGEAIATHLVAQGCRVVGLARRADRLEALTAKLGAERFVAVTGDVCDASARERFVATAHQHFGRIDVLINNAGWGLRGPLERVDLASVRSNFETNVFALLGVTQLALPHLRESRGRIVMIGSVAGRIARPLTSVYDSTKHALEALTDGLRGELKPWGVRVSLIRPGFIETEFVDAASAASAHTLENLGPYAPYLSGHREKSKNLRRVAAGPAVIARLAVHAALSAYPKTHYAAPFHAKLFLFLNWLLPRSLIDRVVGMVKRG